MDDGLIISLLTICVVLLSAVVVGLLAIVIALLTKLRQLAVKLDKIANNVASATDWLAPSKVIGEVVKLFRK